MKKRARGRDVVQFTVYTRDATSPLAFLADIQTSTPHYLSANLALNVPHDGSIFLHRRVPDGFWLPTWSEADVPTGRIESGDARQGLADFPISDLFIFNLTRIKICLNWQVYHIFFLLRIPNSPCVVLMLLSFWGLSAPPLV